MQKQDLNGVRTAQDIERKYDFSKILGLSKNFETQEKTLLKLQNELNDTLNSFVINLQDELDSQSEISLWFYSGKPTLLNEPYINFEIPEEHIGDLYYDKENGIVYKLKSGITKNDDNEEITIYYWEINTNPDLTQAMALTNIDYDTTIDCEKKIFFNSINTPYNEGDWFLSETGEFYICKNSKSSEEEANINDFNDSNDYTTSLSKKLDDTISTLKGCMKSITDSYVQFTDLATGGSTTIAGDNIKTGNIQSNNYSQNQAGMRINMTNGTIDTKNFKVDKNGNVRLGNGAKFIGGDGVLTNLQFVGELNYAGYRYPGLNFLGYAQGSEITKTAIEFDAYIPNDFVIESAKLIIVHTPVYYNGAYSGISGVYTGFGFARNLKAYISSSDNLNIEVAGMEYSIGDKSTYTELKNEDGLNVINDNGITGWTPSTPSTTSRITETKISDDFSSSLVAGKNNRIKVETSNSVPSGAYNDLKQTGAGYGILIITGWTPYNEDSSQ